MEISDSLLDAMGRMEGEPGRAWLALVEYARSAYKEGTDHTARSLRALARTSGRRLSTVARWSSRFNWQERVELYDRAVAEMRVRVWAKRRLEVDERDYLEGEKMRKAGLRGLEQNLTAMDGGEIMAPVNVSRLIVEGSKLQRLATGAPTERTEQTISKEFESTLDKIYGNRDGNNDQASE